MSDFQKIKHIFFFISNDKIYSLFVGTTYSCVGVYLAGTGEVEVLKDEQGHKCIPSVVAFK
jgi:stress 70 chaperone-associated protein